MPEEELIDIKFRLYDGSDMGPFRYSSAATVDMLKQRVVSDWPKGKTVVPKAANEVKLINSGKILENNKTVGHCNVHDVAGGVIIMHVVVQPSLSKTKAGHRCCIFHGFQSNWSSVEKKMLHAGSLICLPISLYSSSFVSVIDATIGLIFFLSKGNVGKSAKLDS